MRKNTMGGGADTMDAARALDALESRARELDRALGALVNTLGKGATADAGFRSQVQELAAVQGSMSALRSLAPSAVPSNAAAAMIAGAQQGVAAFGQVPGGMGAAAMMAAASQAGAGVQYTPAFNAQAWAQGIMGSAAANQSGMWQRSQLAPWLPPAQPPNPMPFANWGAPMGGGRMGAMAGYGWAGHAMAGAVGDYFSTGAQATLAGRPDVMSQAGSAGSFYGSILGGGIGMLFGGPMGAAVGASVGGSLFGGLERFLTAERHAKEMFAVGAAPAAGLLAALHPASGVAPMSTYTAMMGGARPQTLSGSNLYLNRISTWATGQASSITRNFFGGSTDRGPTMQEMGGVYGEMVSSLIAGGVDPFQQTGMSDPFGSMRPGFMNAFNEGARRGSLIETMIGLAGAAAVNYHYRPEDLAKTYTRRLSERYGRAAPEMAKQIEPILRSLPETGGNVADILSRYGAEASYRYGEVQVETGQPAPVSLGALMTVSAGVRSGERQAAFASLQVRGAGQAIMNASLGQMAYLDQLPGGRDSLAYAQASARMRAGQNAMFEEQDFAGYRTRALNLETARGIVSAMPYGPGNRFAIELQQMGLSRERIGELSSRMEGLRDRGELGAEQEYGIRREISALRVGMAQAIGMMSEGGPDLLLPMMAGRPAGAGRIDSLGMTNLRMFQIGSPRRMNGAANGAQLRMQDDFIRSFGLDPAGIGPVSRMSGVDNTIGGGNLNETNTLLRELIQEIRRGNSGAVQRSRYPGESGGAPSAGGMRQGGQFN